jgi:hypothetical protein
LEHPLQQPLEHPTRAPLPVQPVLTGMETHLDVGPVRAVAAVGAGPHPAGARPKGRRRYWSIRDLSRRLWLGRGYELLCDLVRTGILPATRSARSWWIDDADVLSLRAVFDDRAGKVRAFRRLEGWLRERAWAVPAGAETAALSHLGDPVGHPAVFHWRGTAYLPRSAWRTEAAPTGGFVYRHASGAALAA